MRHTVEIADSSGNTMRLSVNVDSLGTGGSWYAIDQGMLRYHNGPIKQERVNSAPLSLGVFLLHGGTYGVTLWNFVGLLTVNDEGSGWVHQSWVLGLEPGSIDWSLV